MLGLRFCARAFSSRGERGPLFIAVRRPLTVAASLVRDIFDCQDWGVLLLASDGWRSRRLLNFLQCTGRPPAENDPTSRVRSAEVENHGLHADCLHAVRDSACHTVDAQKVFVGWMDGWMDG